MRFVRLKDGRILNLDHLVCMKPFRTDAFRGRTAEVMFLNYPHNYVFEVDADDQETITKAIEKSGGLL